MIRLSEVGGLYKSIPANIKDARTKAFADACDRQIKKLLEYAEKIKVWCAIEQVDERYLDFLATDCRTLFYESALNEITKKNLIVNSQYWYMKLGTADAIEEILEIIFGNESAVTIEEWFEYGGMPYHFRIILKNAESNPEQNKRLRQMLGRIKRLSAQLDAIRYVYNYIVEQSIAFEMQMEYISEFYPRYNIPPHRLDGMTRLDGSQCLDGRLAEAGPELYPATLRMVWEARAALAAGTGLAAYGSAAYTLEGSMAMAASGTADASATTAEMLHMQAGARVDLQAVCGLRIERNYKCLDGTEMLDGTETLNAEAHEVQL